jgi:hypothetical protein
LPTSTYLLSGSGVVLSGASEAMVQLISVGITSAFQGILSYTLKKYNFFAYYFILLTIFTAIVEEYQRLSSFGFKKKIPTKDNTIGRMWTNEMSCL